MIRLGQRYKIECDSKCVLTHGGIDYQGIIGDISLGGALLRLDDSSPEALSPGSVCVLMLCSNPNVCPVKYTCKVIRRDAAITAVQFLELDYGHYKLNCQELLLNLAKS